MEGPFYKPGYPQKKLVCGNDTKINEDKLTVHGYVLVSCDGEVAEGATVEVWQANTDGQYVDDCRGYAMTDRNGYYIFTTAYPGIYRPRPRHLHFRVTYQNYVLITQMYFDDDTSHGKVHPLTAKVNYMDIEPRRRISQFDFILS